MSLVEKKKLPLLHDFAVRHKQFVILVLAICLLRPIYWVTFLLFICTLFVLSYSHSVIPNLFANLDYFVSGWLFFLLAFYFSFGSTLFESWIFYVLWEWLCSMLVDNWYVTFWVMELVIVSDVRDIFSTYCDRSFDDSPEVFCIHFAGDFFVASGSFASTTFAWCISYTWTCL